MIQDWVEELNNYDPDLYPGLDQNLDLESDLAVQFLSALMDKVEKTTSHSLKAKLLGLLQENFFVLLGDLQR